MNGLIVLRPRFGRIRPLIGALLLCPFLLGCPSRPDATRKSIETEQEDSLAVVRDTLRRDVKIDVCKTAIAQINAHLSRVGDQADQSKPAAASSAERELFTGPLQLTETELAEVNRSNFSPLDAHHLEECYLLNDALRSLRLDFADKTDAGSRRRAHLAFDWAMRQVWLFSPPPPPLSPTQALRIGWLVDRNAAGLPPVYTLRVGFGTTNMRAALALALFQQLGLDAGFVSPVGDKKSLRVWAVGIRIGDEIELFDPRAGKPLLTADGKNALTLKQVKAAPDLAAPSLAADGLGGDPKAVVAESQVWLCPSLSSLAPRMRWLQSVISSNPQVVFGVDALSLRDRIAKTGAKVDFFNPPGDSIGPVRSLAMFIPPADGGLAKPTPNILRTVDRYTASLIPLDRLPAPIRDNIVIGEPQTRLLMQFTRRFEGLALETGRARDRMLRGQFDDANRSLSEDLTRIDTLQKRIGSETNLEEEATKWAKDMTVALAAFLRLRDNPAAGDLNAAKSRKESLERNSEKIDLLIEQAAAEPYADALTFQLALCKHEQAERMSRDRSSAEARREAWENAVSWWNNYLTRFASAPWRLSPAQFEHARQLLAIAQQELKKL